MDGPRFQDRRDAGRKLAVALAEFRGRDAMVLGLPRGGVVVAAEIARGLALPLDVIEVRKIGAPGQPELAAGAVASGGILVWNELVLRQLRLDRGRLAAAVERARAELRERDATYRRARRQPDLNARAVLVVDDGCATGATMLAAVQAVRKRHPEIVVAAAPLIPSGVVALLERVADRVVSCAAGDEIGAVGEAYVDFNQVDDNEVIAALRAAWPSLPNPTVREA